jgi:hypothetical protein
MGLAFQWRLHMDEPETQSKASAQGRTPPSQLAARAAPEDPLEELIEMRYQHFLAQRGLQELFENGALQCLES